MLRLCPLAFGLLLIQGACLGREAQRADDILSGGETTVFDTTRDAFSRPARNLTDAQRDRFFVGNAIFNRNWVTAPGSVTSIDGLGPRFHARACSACHPRDGRGAPPTTDTEIPVALLFRLSIPGTDAHGGPRPEPTYGGQFAPIAILGVPADGQMVIRYAEIQGAYADGEPYTLRQPTYGVSDLAHGPTHPELMISPRIAPALIGMGLLEAISEESLLRIAAAQRRGPDGIEGRPNYVWDVKANRTTLGRFGWKANQPTVEQQVAAAFNGDIGITSSLFPKQPCTDAQAECRGAISGGDPEINNALLSDVVAYSRTLAVPARRNADDAGVRRGQRLFTDIGCARCHTPSHTTAVHPELPQLSHQLIHPYTDLLLHDMGEALADHRPDFAATGRQWRTPPLWGIGLVMVVNRHTYFLHDGRARNLEEAILWHDGEALPARERFRGLTRSDRLTLLRFLESL
jgi:CxxC motif-containing protein (DUF1111 family)